MKREHRKICRFSSTFRTSGSGLKVVGSTSGGRSERRRPFSDDIFEGGVGSTTLAREGR